VQYCPPEKCKLVLNSKDEASASLPADTSYDIWSLGCVLFEALTAQPLFSPRTDDELSDDKVDEAKLTTQQLAAKRGVLQAVCEATDEDIADRLAAEKRLIPDDLRSVLKKMLHVDPRQRISVADLLSHAAVDGGLTKTMAFEVRSCWP